LAVPPIEINGKLIKTQLLRKPVIQAIEHDVSPFSPNNVMVSTSGYYAVATGITTPKKTPTQTRVSSHGRAKRDKIQDLILKGIYSFNFRPNV
jgi:hypothetical protein